MSTEEEQNKALVRRLCEAIDEGNLDAMREMLAPDFVDHGLLPGQEDPGREGYIRSIAEQLPALSSHRTTIEYQATDEDKVITHYTSRSIHDRGPLFGIAPTGKERAVAGIVIDRIQGGKIVEEWSVSNAAPFLEDLAHEMRERERMEQEMKVARTIQQASLPKEVPSLAGWQITPFYQPAKEVGGDFYEFFELDGGRMGLVIGDATGKGVPAALVENATCAFLGGVATASGSSPGEVLSQVNEAVLTRIPPNMFVTCFYAVLEPESGRLTYANAGHTLPCCRRRQEGRTDELVARGMPLGLMQGMSYEEKETTLLPGDDVLLCTDGLVEAHSPQGEIFGVSRLRSLLSNHPEGGKYLHATLMGELGRFTGEGWEQEDDITLLTLERSASQG